MASVNIKGDLKINGVSIFDLIYPIGSIYETESSSFNPNTSFGGTWERIKGKVIVGVDENDTDLSSSKKTGGEKTHTLEEAEIPIISGGLQFHQAQAAGFIYNASGRFHGGEKIQGKYFTGTMQWDSNAFSYGTVDYSFGGGGAHNNMPPYYVAYIWRRTA